MLKSDTDYGHVLLPSDPEDTLLAALKAINDGTFEGRLPGKGRSKLSALYPAIQVVDDGYLFAFGAHAETRTRARLQPVLHVLQPVLCAACGQVCTQLQPVLHAVQIRFRSQLQPVLHAVCSRF